jgi:hypothetical protein
MIRKTGRYCEMHSNAWGVKTSSATAKNTSCHAGNRHARVVLHLITLYLIKKAANLTPSMFVVSTHHKGTAVTANPDRHNHLTGPAVPPAWAKEEHDDNFTGLVIASLLCRLNLLAA